MKMVAVECPLTRPAYAAACWRDCVERGECPLPPLSVFQGTIKTLEPENLETAIEGYYLWADKAEKVVLYTDCGITANMRTMACKALVIGRAVEFRSLTPGSSPDVDVFSILGSPQ